MTKEAKELPFSKEDIEEAHPPMPKYGNTMNSLSLFLNICFWYIFTALSNVYAKKYMQNSGDPLMVTNFSFFFAAMGWLALKMSHPRMNPSVMLERLWPVAVLHIGNTYLTNVSMKHSDIKFTYTIKAGEPLMTALLAYFVLGQRTSKKLVLSLVPIPIGMALATLTDIAFTPYSLFSAILSIGLSSARSVVFKGDSDRMDFNAEELYLRLGLLSFLLTTPVQIFLAIFFPYPVKPDYIPFQIGDIFNLGTRHEGFRSLVLAGAFHFLYNLFSFKVLKAVSPLTHGLANVMKRITTIVYSIIYFKTPLSVGNVFGILISNLGVLLYGYFQRSEPKASYLKITLKPDRVSPKNLCGIIGAAITVFILIQNEVFIGRA